VRLLLDTHALLWFVAGSRELTSTARRSIEEPRNERLVSLASVWEVAIKVSLGRLRLGAPIADLVERGVLGNAMASPRPVRSIARLPGPVRGARHGQPRRNLRCLRRATHLVGALTLGPRAAAMLPLR
jgi:hypothetical protein